MTVKKKGNSNLILTETFPSVYETWYLKVLTHDQCLGILIREQGHNHYHNMFVLYCFDGVVIAAQCTATFLRSIGLPRI